MRSATARLLLAYATVSAAFLFLLTFATNEAAAEGAEGTWTPRNPGEGFVQDTWPADWHYDVKLTLSGGSGTWWMKVVRVTNVQPGQESARSTVGNSFSYRVTYTSTSSGINLRMEGKTLPLKISGGYMTGSGSYDPGDGSTLRWTVDLKGGSGMGAMGDMASVAMAGAAVGVAGGIAGMAAAAVPAPKPIPRGPAPSQSAGQQFWNVHRPQGPIYPNAPPQRPYTVAPGDARPYEPVPFDPGAPDPSQMQSLGGIGLHYGPPDTPPPPTPPHGGEKMSDPNPHHLPAPPGCGAKCMPYWNGKSWRWQCTGCGSLPWG